MIVVSDTSPLSALMTIGRPEILEKLFGEIIVPAAVWNELSRFHNDLLNYPFLQKKKG